MNKVFSGLLGITALAFPAAAEGYPIFHPHYSPYYPYMYHPPAPVAVGFGTENVSFWIQSTPVSHGHHEPIKLNQFCIYKPWKNRTVCRY